jgi:hypothetical protein
MSPIVPSIFLWSDQQSSLAAIRREIRNARPCHHAKRSASRQSLSIEIAAEEFHHDRVLGKFPAATAWRQLPSFDPDDIRQHN